MNTKEKILATTSVAIGLDVLGGIILNFGKEFSAIKIMVDTLANVVFSTLPSGLAIIFDKYVNQNITSNKPVQYVMTAAEGFVMIPSVGSLHNQEIFFHIFCKVKSSL